MNTRNHFKSGFLRAALMLLLAVMTFPTEAWADNVKYIDEDGGEQTCTTATKITSETTSLVFTPENARWYYVGGEVSINGSMEIRGNVNIILCDGAELKINNNLTSLSGKNITIFAQSSGANAGKLTVNSDEGVAFLFENVTINGGIISVTSTKNTGIYCISSLAINGGKVTATGDMRGIYCSSSITINGGKVTATGGWFGIHTDGTITLGWTHATDFVWFSSYYGTVKIADGQTLYIGTTAYSGTVSDPSTIAGKRLTPDLWGITSGNDGSETKPYTITNTAGLDLLAKMVNGTDGYTANNFSGKYFVLGKDITYTHLDASETGADTENNYTAIGGYNSNFEGTFDGQGHTVSGIRIYKGGSDDGDCYQGLFGNIVRGTVRHVTLDDAQITGHDFTGSIVGYNNEGNITDCHVTENVCISAQQNTLYHGGIVGNNDGSVSGCTSKAKIKINSSSSFEFGGIAGCNDDGTIKDCLYLGSVVEGGEASNNVGAITGSNKTDGSIINCYYTNEDFMGQVTPGTPPDNNAIGENSVTATNTGLARTITLGEGVTLSGTAADYGPASPNTSDVRITSYATAADQPGFALKLETVSGTTTTTTYYSTSGATVALSYSGTVPTGSALNYKATKTSGGTDVTSTVISGSTLTMPDYDVSITAEVKEPVAYAVLSDNEDGEGTKSLTFKYGAHTLATTNEWNVSNTGSNHPGWEDQCSSITKVVFDESFANARPKNCFHWFYGCANLTAITGLNNFNTSEVADMSGMFNGCSSLTSLDLSNFNTSEVTDMNHMFHYCSGLTSITFGEHFSTSKVGNMDNMFSGCTALANGTLTVKGTTAPSISQDIFSVFTHGTLFTDLTASDLNVTENTTGNNAGYFTWEGGKFVACNNRVSYLDESGVRQFKDNATRITSSSNGATYGSGWYFVAGNVAINGQLVFADDAHLILCDGANMTVYKTNGEAIYGNEANIAIYGQSTGDGMGSLTAKGSSSGIYSYSQNGGSCITINGGQVTATGGVDGIYALTSAGASSVTVNGGQVTAIGDLYGIGVHSPDGASSVTVTGGLVTATGGVEGIYSQNGDITLGWTNADDFIKSSSYMVKRGGRVKTAAGKRFIAYDADTGTAANCIIGDASSTRATAIGSGISLSSATAAKTIAGKTLRPLDGYTVSTTDGNISLKDGTTTKDPDFTIGTGTITTSYYIYPANTSTTNTLDYSGEVPTGCVLEYKAMKNSDGTDVTSAVISGSTLTMPDYDVTIDAGCYITNVPYIGWDDTNKTYITDAKTPDGTKIWVLNGTVTRLGAAGEDTWYVAKGELAYSNTIYLLGNVNLILEDGAKMTVGTNHDHGAISSGDGSFANSLSIYAQSNGDNMGILSATSMDANGYVSHSTIDAGSITINGGKVSATGLYGLFTTGAKGATGDFTINGGIVTARAMDDSRSAIFASNKFTVNGGQVKAVIHNGADEKPYTIYSDKGITLGWTNATDFIQASSYKVYNGTVKIPAGKSFYYTAGDNMTFLGNANDDYVFGAEGNATLGDIANKKLIPALPIDASQSYFMRTFDGNWKPIDGGKTFLPDGYDLAKGVVTLKEVAGAPDGLPVIFGPEDEKQPSTQYFVVGASGDEAKTIQDDYDNVVKDMSKRFVITDGKKTLAKILEGIEDVDASEAIVLMLVNGKFTTVDVSADDLGKKAKPGLLLFVLTKWEYMHIEPSTQPISAPQSTRAIGIDFGNDFTGVKEVKEVREVKEDWYSLDGRKLDKAPTKKGVYIRSGVKVIIK